MAYNHSLITWDLEMENQTFKIILGSIWDSAWTKQKTISEDVQYNATVLLHPQKSLARQSRWTKAAGYTGGKRYSQIQWWFIAISQFWDHTMRNTQDFNCCWSEKKNRVQKNTVLTCREVEQCSACLSVFCSLSSRYLFFLFKAGIKMCCCWTWLNWDSNSFP